MTLFFLKQRTYMSAMMQKEEGATPQASHSESKGPWDIPGSGDSSKAGGGKPAAPPASGGDDDAKSANPWEPQSASSGRARGPSLEEIFRRGGGKGGGGHHGGGMGQEFGGNLGFLGGHTGISGIPALELFGFELKSGSAQRRHT